MKKLLITVTLAIVCQFTFGSTTLTIQRGRGGYAHCGGGYNHYRGYCGGYYGPRPYYRPGVVIANPYYYGPRVSVGVGVW